MIRAEQDLGKRWDDADRIRNNITHGLEGCIVKISPNTEDNGMVGVTADRKKPYSAREDAG